MCNLTDLIVHMLIQSIRIKNTCIKYFRFHIDTVDTNLYGIYCSRLNGMNVDTVDTIIKYLQC